MKKKLALLFVLGASFFYATFAGGAEYTQEQILKELEGLKQTMQFQEIKIQQLRAALVAAQEKQEKKAEEKVSLANSLIDQLTIKGDLRVRYERRDRDNPEDSYDAQNRWRTRFRLGGIWKNKTENWEVGAGLAAGGSDGRSTNDTWGEESIFETGDIRLDYAYAKHKFEEFTLTAGQQVNPFQTSWLFWDSDLRPTGFTAQYANKMGLFATVGGYGVRFYSTPGQDTAMLAAGQVGYKNKIGDVKVLAAVGYQHFDGVFSNREAPNPSYDFQIGDFYTKVSVPIGIAELSPYGQIWCNFGADGNAGKGQLKGDLDPSDENLGWVLGMDATINKMFKLGYAYAVVEADSIHGPLTDSDFGNGLSDTDMQGHKISAFVDVTKNISTGVTAFFYEAAERKNQREVDLYQFDVNYKF